MNYTKLTATSQATPAQLAKRSKLYEMLADELAVIFQKKDRYEQTGKQVSVSAEDIEIIGVTRDHKTELIQEVQKIIEKVPSSCSVYVLTNQKDTSAQLLAAFDYQQKSYETMTDVFLIEDVHYVMAALLEFAETGNATILSYSSIGRFIGAPSISKTTTLEDKSYGVLCYLKSDNQLLFPQHQTLYLFLKDLREAYPTSPYLRVYEDGDIIKLFLNNDQLVQTGAIYQKNNIYPPVASVGLPQLSGYVFHQFLFTKQPPLLEEDNDMLYVLQRLQTQALPQFQDILRSGLNQLKDNRFYLSHSSLDGLRATVEELIWEEVHAYFETLKLSVENIVRLTNNKQEITNDFAQNILQSLQEAYSVEDFFVKIFPYIQQEIETSYFNAVEVTNQLIRLRKYFQTILAKITGLRAVAIGAEATHAVAYFQDYYTKVSRGTDRTIQISTLRNGEPIDVTMLNESVPSVVCFHGLIELLIGFFTNFAYWNNRHQTITYTYFDFRDTVIDDKPYMEIIAFCLSSRIDENLLRLVNDPYAPTEDADNPHLRVFKHLQTILERIHKLDRTTKPGQKNLRSMFHVGSLTTEQHKRNDGFYVKVALSPILSD
ncbi:MAG: hypothetical protein ACOCXQ_01770 [Patescibacteria group bacterium]